MAAIRQELQPLPSAVEARPVPLLALTSLRFIAAFMVVLGHFGGAAVQQVFSFWWPLATVAGAIVWSGMTAVSFFFILSGFVLAYTYCDQDGNMKGTRRAFWVARFARIYPIYIGAFALTLAAVAFFRPSLQLDPEPARFAWPIPTALATIGLIQTWVPSWSETWNGPGWSLSVEAFFYLLFPVLGVLVSRSRHLLYLCAIFWVAEMVPAVILQTHPSFWITWALSTPLSRVPEFLLGIALGRFFVIHGASLRVPRWAMIASVVVVLLVMSLGPALPFYYLHNGMLDPLFVLLIYYYASRPLRRRHVLLWPSTIVLGEASYGLYILHWPAWTWISYALPVPAHHSLRYLQYVGLYLILIVSLSVASFLWFERPARRAIRRHLTPMATTVARH